MSPTANIPIIDISGSSVAEADIARQLVDAAAEHGFIYIKNTGNDISIADVDGAFGLSRKLFAAPVEEKALCKIQQNNRGWSGMHTETLDPSSQRVGDYKEAFNFGEFVNGKAQQPLPETIQPYESQINSFADTCHKLCVKILYLLGVGLAVDPPDFFSAAHLQEKGDSGTILRLLYYPPHATTTAEETDIRAGAHSDYGSVTLLFRLKGQAGLEILTRENTWAPVPVYPPGTEDDPAPPILINIGDLLSYWTNGLFRSTVHRVVFPSSASGNLNGETDTGPRYSIAFFCHPVNTSLLDPVPSERVKSFVAPEGTPNANPYAERKVMTAVEHLQMRLRASYLSLYEEDTAKS